MNRVELRLPELELAEHHLQEALQCLLHTIVFTRWPQQKGPLQPVEVQCDHFPLAFASCGKPEVHRRIDQAIHTFVQGLVPAGPELLRGTITLSFFERRTNKVVFWAYEEKVVWEEWIIPLLVSNTPQLNTADERLSASERDTLHQIQGSAERRYADGLQALLLQVFTHVNASLDHVPPHHYDFEISSAQRDQREAFRTRVMSAPLPVPVT